MSNYSEGVDAYHRNDNGIPNIYDDPSCDDSSPGADDTSLDILNELNEQKDNKSVRPNNILTDSEISAEKIEYEIKKLQSAAMLHNVLHPSENYTRRVRNFHDNNYYRNLHDSGNIWGRERDDGELIRLIYNQTNMIRNMQNTITALYGAIVQLVEDIDKNRR